MIYLSHFTFPDREREYDFFLGEKRTCYDSFYPFQILSRRNLRMLDFEPVTILYGGNGSGKTTALNVIGETLGLERDTLYNRSNFFESYTGLCSYETMQPIPKGSRIITSDDVFDFMLNLRSLNEGIDQKREEIFAECGSIPTGRAPSCIFQKRFRRKDSICWMSRRTVYLPCASRSWSDFWRILPDFLAASLSFPHILLFCCPCEVQKSMIWMRIRWM